MMLLVFGWNLGFLLNEVTMMILYTSFKVQSQDWSLGKRFKVTVEPTSIPFHKTNQAFYRSFPTTRKK